jgi:hypothetical protein
MATVESARFPSGPSAARGLRAALQPSPRLCCRGASTAGIVLQQLVKSLKSGAPGVIRTPLCLRSAMLILRAQNKPKLSPARGSANASGDLRTVSPQVFLLYHRLSYDCTCPALGAARAGHVTLRRSDGMVRSAQTSTVLPELIRYCNAVPRRGAVS